MPQSNWVVKTKLFRLPKMAFTRLAFAFLISLFVLGGLLLTNTVKTATPPTIISYQGKLLESGASVTTTKSMAFLLYDASSGGSLLYTAGGTLASTSTVSITPSQGIFSVDLGSGITNSIDSTIFKNNSTIYLEVWVDGTALSPRKQITASPFAMNSKYLMGYETATASSSVYIPLSDSNGNLTFSGDPQSSGVSGGLVYINPASADANETLFGIALNGAEKFRVDEDGDGFLAGSMEVGTSTNSNVLLKVVSNDTTSLTVQGETSGGAHLKVQNGNSVGFQISQASNYVTNYIGALNQAGSLYIKKSTNLTGIKLSADSNSYINQNLFIGTTGSEAITTSTFALSGNDMYVADMLGVGNAVFIENDLYIGTSTLHLNGDVDGGVISMTGGALTIDSASTLSLNTTNNQNVVIGTGNFGIGTSTPNYALTVSGTTYISGLSTLGGNLALSGNDITGVDQIIGNSTYITVGDAGSSSRAFTTNDDLFVSGRLEVDGNSFFDGRLSTSDLFMLDDGNITFGGSSDSFLDWSTNEATAETLIWALGTNSQSIVFTKVGNQTKSFDHGNQTNPTIFIHSATDPDSDNTQWLSLTHDQTNGVISTGAGDINLMSATGFVGINTTTPSYALDVSGKVALDGTVVLYRPTAMTGSLIIGDGGTNLSNTTGNEGYYNTFVGLGSGSANTAGLENTLIGYNTAKALTIGNQNVVIGFVALAANIGGSGNTVIGRASLYANVASNNTALGWGSGRYLTNGTSANINGNNSLYLGYNTKALADGGTNEIVIGYDATGNGSNSVTLGNDNITDTFLKGNVGIGTTSTLTNELNVEASGGAAISIGTKGSAGSTASPYEPTLNFRGYNNAIKGSILVQDRSASVNGGWMKFSTADSSAVLQDRMIIDNAGYVGIGTNIPNHLFTMGTPETPIGTTAQAGFYNAGNSLMIFRDTTNDVEGGFGTNASGSNVFMGAVSNHNLTFRTNNSPKMTILAAGNVGIGTSTPQSILDIQSTSVNKTKINLDGSQYNSLNNVGIEYFLANSVGTRTKYGSILMLNQDMTAGAEKGRMRFFVSNSADGGGNEAMTILGSNVGINTTTPGYKLTVSGTAYIASTLSMGGNILMAGNDITGVDQIIGNLNNVTIGDAGTDSHDLTTNDDLFVSGAFEVDGYSFFDSSASFTAGVTLGGVMSLAGNDITGVDQIIGNSTVITIGDAGTTSHTLNANDDLFISGKLEVDGAAYFDSTAVFDGLTTIGANGDIVMLNNTELQFGNSQDSRLDWSTGQTVDTMIWGLDDVANSIIFTQTADRGYDFAHSAQTNPTVFIHSANQSTSEWLSLTHNQTDGTISTGAGDINLMSATGFVGINTTTANYNLEVDGNAYVSRTINMGNELTLNGKSLLIDGDMETDGVGAWAVGSNAILTKETTDPVTGVQNLRIAYNGTNQPSAFQSIVTSGKKYRVRGWARGDGTFKPNIDSPNATAQWNGTTSTTWQYFDITFVAAGASIFLESDCTSAGYVEFDDVSVFEVESEVASINTGYGDLNLRPATGFVGINTTTPGYGLTVSGTAYISGASTFAGQTLTKGNVLNPTIVSTFQPGGLNGDLDGISKVRISGNYAYTSAGAKDQLVIINIADPTSPTTTAIFQPGGLNGDLDNISDVAIANNYAYALSYDKDQLVIIDITNPASPTTTAIFQPGGLNGDLNGARTIKIVGNYAYIAALLGGKMTIVDISDPYNPTLVSTFNASGTLTNMFGFDVVGNYAYLTTSVNDKMVIADISDPYNPSLVSTYQPNGVGGDLDGTRDVRVVGNYAYLTAFSNNSIAVVDVSNPESPTTISIFKPGTADLYAPEHIEISGNYAYVSTYSNATLKIIDITDKSNLSIVSSLSVSGPGGLALKGNYVYQTATSNDSLLIIDITGATISNTEIGTAQIDNLQVFNFSRFENGVDIKGGLSIGRSGLLLNGNFGMSNGTNSSTLTFASSTLFTSNLTDASASDTAFTFNTNSFGTSNLFKITEAGSDVFVINREGTGEFYDTNGNAQITFRANNGSISARIGAGGNGRYGQINLIDESNNGRVVFSATSSVDSYITSNFLVGSPAESIADANFVMNGQDFYVHDKLGVNGDSYFDGTLNIAGINQTSPMISLTQTPTLGNTNTILDITAAGTNWDPGARALMITTLTDTTITPLTINAAGQIGIAFMYNSATRGGLGLDADSLNLITYGAYDINLIPDTTGITVIGDAGSTSHTLNANDDLFVSGKLEVDGAAYFDGNTFIAGITYITQNKDIRSTAAYGSIMPGNSFQTLPSVTLHTGITANSILISELNDYTYNFSHTLQTNPTVFIHSANQSTSEWLSLTHDQTNGYITTGKGYLVLDSALGAISMYDQVLMNFKPIYFGASVANPGLYGANAAGLYKSLNIIAGGNDYGISVVANANKTNDYSVATTTNTHFRVYSATAAATSKTQYIEMYHNQTDGTISTGAGDINLMSATGYVGINTTTANYNLEVDGNAYVSRTINMGNELTLNGKSVLIDGDMEKSGVGEWSETSFPTITKETTNPHGGLQILRVAGTGIANAGAFQSIIVVGKTYRLTGWARGNGTNAPRVVNFASSLWTGTSSTDWQYFDITFVGAGGTSLVLGQSASTGYVEFDDISVFEVESEVASINTGYGDLNLRPATGFVGINTTTPSYALDISGKVALDGTVVLYRPTAMTGSLIIGDGGTNLSNTSGIEGYYNTFVGINSGEGHTTGFYNTAVGFNTLKSVTSTSGNTAFGTETLRDTIGTDNTGIGSSVLMVNTTGDNNTGFGSYALSSNTTGDDNTAVGYGAGRSITGGSIANATSTNSLYLGYNTRAFASGDTNEIVIGHTTTGNGSNSVTLGNASITKTILRGAITFTAGSIPDAAHIFDTDTAFTSPGDYLFSVRTGGTAKFSVEGDGTVRAAGQLFASSATVGTPGAPGDLAERVDINPAYIVEAGDVLVVDSSSSDMYTKSQGSYVQEVAGVVSTNPTITVGNGKTQHTAVMAMVGRVPIKVSAENGQIERGDLLITASVPGHAMRYDPTKDTGDNVVGIVGIALDSLTTSTGKIMGLIKTGWVNNKNQTIAQMQQDLISVAQDNAINIQADPSQLTVVPSGSSILPISNDLNLNNFSIINVRSLIAIDNTWSVDVEGRFITKIITTEGDKNLYALQSQDTELIYSGSGTLVDGEFKVLFSAVESEIIDADKPIKVSITLTAEANGIFVSQKDVSGFTVKELQSGTSNATFDWVVIASRRIGPAPVVVEPIPEPIVPTSTPTTTPEILVETPTTTVPVVETPTTTPTLIEPVPEPTPEPVVAEPIIEPTPEPVIPEPIVEEPIPEPVVVVEPAPVIEPVAVDTVPAI
ncbi:MAG: hypothetical protein L3J07_04005 [Candidatus Magasanikbacteria bacterium]|nr:hypothetical protein [Candidatus Magasanikbacteria bacterium]